MTAEEKAEIQETLDDCIEARVDYGLSEEGGDLINEGWIEALQYVLGIGKKPDEQKTSK